MTVTYYISGVWKCDDRSKVIDSLRRWANIFNVPQVAVKAVVNIINANFNANLPADPRTLMKTPRSVIYTEIGNGIDKGLYWHQGLEFCLRNCFKDLGQSISISININIDGLPLYRSSNKTFWPILFNIHEYPSIRPMALGIFFGESKPSCVRNYLLPFVEEIKPLLQNGLELNGHKIRISIRCFICDSPARAFIKGLFIIYTPTKCLLIF